MQQLEEKAMDKENSTPATGMKVIWREFLKDKLALFSFIILIVIILTTFIWAQFINSEKVMEINLMTEFARPGTAGFILGADQGGSDVLGQLILGARNSLAIAISITVITGLFGVFIGLVAGYFGGIVDVIVMRILDFYMTLPTLMIIIVFVTIIPKYNVITFVLIMSAFLWVGTARLIRSKVLSEGKRDYVDASKTMGTSHLKIMLRGILPNISSLLIVELTLNFAGNVGIETGLSFLGFGLPPNVPSLGTLVGTAKNQVVLENYLWVWLPASMLILVLMLAINYVGQALRRAADSKQRIG